MTKQQAERWVRLAWILGALSGGLTIVANLAFGSRGVLDPWNIEVCLLWMLAFGIYRRNRIAAVAMVAYYVAVRLIVFGSGVSLRSRPVRALCSAVFWWSSSICKEPVGCLRSAPHCPPGSRRSSILPVGMRGPRSTRNPPWQRRQILASLPLCRIPQGPA